MVRNRKVTVNQMQDAKDILQRVLETETFTLTVQERVQIMDVKRTLKLLCEMRESK